MHKEPHPSGMRLFVLLPRRRERPDTGSRQAVPVLAPLSNHLPRQLSYNTHVTTVIPAKKAHIIMRFFIIGVALLTLLGTTVAARAGGNGNLLALVGEDHHYGIDFLVFQNLAEGSLSFAAETTPGHYRAELEARTLGVAAWLTGDRTQRYVTVMEETADGSLRSISYESTVIKRKNGAWTHRGKRYRFDYQAGKVYLDQSDGEKFKPAKEFPLPAGSSPVDILTGFYNLRLGVYGKLAPGARLQIPTFTSKGVSAIDVEVLTDKDRQALTFFPHNGTLLRVRVDPEIFNTGDAGLYAFFDETGRPSHGIVEDIIGMGDVYGYLQPPVVPKTVAKLP